MMRMRECTGGVARAAGKPCVAARPARRERLGGRSGRALHRARRLHGTMVGALLLVLLDAAVELVAQRVDRGVHVRLGRIRVDVASPHVQRGLGLLPQLLDGENTVHVDHLVEMARDALEKLLLDIAPQRGGDFDMVTREVEPHMPSPCELSVRYIARGPALRRSLEGAIPRLSRYFATVRRATGMPSLESSSAIRPSLSGSSESSSFTSFLILARMAVEEVPE